MNAFEKNFITIVYNNIPGGTVRSLQPGLGFSAFVQFKGKKFLFDTGADASILTNNARALALDIADLDAIVISHNHWDHVYGLPAMVAHGAKSLPVIVPGPARASIQQQNPGAEVVPVKGPTEILPRVWSTGSIDTHYRDAPLSEQSLILDDDDGLYVLTGCAHAGIVSVMERVKEIFADKPIHLAAGGFHLVDATGVEIGKVSSRLRELGVKDIAPSHCTGRPAIEFFQKEWGEHYRCLYLGHTYYFGF